MAMLMLTIHIHLGLHLISTVLVELKSGYSIIVCHLSTALFELFSICDTYDRPFWLCYVKCC